VVHTWASSAAHLLPLLLHSPTPSLRQEQGGEEETGGGDKQTHGSDGVRGVRGLDWRTPLTPLACALARSGWHAEGDANSQGDAGWLGLAEGDANIQQEGGGLGAWLTRCRVLRPAPASQSDTDLNVVAWSVCLVPRASCVVRPLPLVSRARRVYRQFSPRSSGGGSSSSGGLRGLGPEGWR
jgi:hypothetical protein